MSPAEVHAATSTFILDFHFQKESQVDETTLSLLDEVGIISNLLDTTQQSAGKTQDIDMAALLKAMNKTLITSVESRIAYHFG